MRYRVFRPVDGVTVSRAVVDRSTGEEAIVEGPRDQTFTEALERRWPFQRSRRPSEWRVEDTRGNDIAMKRLGEHADLVYLVAVEYDTPVPVHEEVVDEEYPSIEGGVEFYD